MSKSKMKMRKRSLLIVALLFALAVGTTNAQNAAQHLRDGEIIPVQGFEDGLGEWTKTGGVINSNFYHYGTHSFRIKTGCLFSPELPETENGVHVSFYYAIRDYGPSTPPTPTEFRVGYSMTTNDPNDFVWGDLVYLDIPSATTEEWNHYEINFPANVKYVAVTKPTASGGYVFLDDFEFTHAECAMPTTPVAVPTSNAVSLSWTGNSSSYSLQYAPFYISNFVEGLGGWTPSFGNQSWELNPFFDETLYCNKDAGSVWSEVSATNPANYLVSPSVPAGSRITFYAKGVSYSELVPNQNSRANENPIHKFKIMVSTVENPNINDFVQHGEVITASNDSWIRYSIDLDPSLYSGTCHVAICHFYTAKAGGYHEVFHYKLAVDNITINYPWETVITGLEATNYMIENTIPETYYAIRLKGDCDQWTDALEVLTSPASLPDTYEFVQNGNWNDPQNWKNWLMPPADGNVVIKARARIPAGYVAEAETIIIDSVSPTYKLTISEGGQLRHSNTNLRATMEKYISAYSNATGNDHYNLLAFPTAKQMTIDPNIFNNLAPNNTNVKFDLYTFDQNEELEWINYEDDSIPDPNYPDHFMPYHNFTTIRGGKGYLYARNADAMIEFNAYKLIPSHQDVNVPLDYVEGKAFAGWNLIGNPFACNAYLTENRQFYRLEEMEEGSRLVLATDMAIAPMEGVFVLAESNGEHATFTSTEPSKNSDNLMDFTLRKANRRTKANIDRTRVVFGEGSNMSHLDLMADPNRLYFPIDNKAMSVVYAQPVGELPLNLEVATEGTFVLNFECRAEGLVYCHLIDNLTGADIDLLQTPEYSFDSRLTDYASRFRVLFAKAEETNNITNEDFAYIFNDNLIISNEGHATLQVIDLQGRIIKSETIEGNAYTAINVVPGVYLLRLVNGNDVKVQKIVVR